MATSIGSATLRIAPPAAGAFQPASGLDLGAIGIRTGGGMGGGLFAAASRAIAPVAVVSALVAGSGAIVSWGAAQVQSLARIESINAQTESAIRSTGGAAGVTQEHVEALAGSLENLTGTEAESVQQGANLLLTFKNIQNGVGAGNDIFDQATTSLVDMARAMGSDPQSAAIQLGKALNDPIAGMAALGRVGIQFTDDQKAVIQSLVESGDVMGAQKIILGELNSQFGGSGAAYAETYAGKVALLGHAWGTFGETIFSAAMPALSAIVGGLTGLLNNALIPAAEGITGVIGLLRTGDFTSGLFGSLQVAEDSGLVDFVLNLREAIVGFLSQDAGPMLTAGIVGILDFLPAIQRAILGAELVIVRDLLPRVIGTWGTFAPAFLSAAVSAFGVLVGAVTAATPGVLAALVGLLPSLVAGVLRFLPQFYGAALSLLLGILTGYVNAYPALIAAVVGALPVLAAAIVGMLPGIVDAALGLFLGLATALVTVIPALLMSIIGILPSLLSTVLGMLPKLVETAIEVFFGLVTALLRVVPTLLSTLVGDVLPSILTTLVGLIPTLTTAALSLFRALVDGTIDGIPLVVSAIGDIVGGMLGFVPHSPAERGPLSGRGWERLRSGGQAIVGSFADGVRASSSELRDAMTALTDAADLTPTLAALPRVRFDAPGDPSAWEPAPDSPADRFRRMRERPAAEREPDTWTTFAPSDAAVADSARSLISRQRSRAA